MAIQGGVQNVKQQLKQLQALQGKSEKAIQRIMSDVRTRVPGWVATEVTKVYNIKKSEVTPTKAGKSSKPAGSIKVKGDTLDTMEIVYRGRVLTPTHFGVRAGKPKASKKDLLKVPGKAIKFKGKTHNKKGKDTVATLSRIQPYKVTWEIIRGERKTAKGDYDTPWFIAPAAKGGGKQIPFQRSPGHPKGFKTVAAHTVSMPQMVSSERTSANINRAITEGLDKRIAQHMKSLEK